MAATTSMPPELRHKVALALAPGIRARRDRRLAAHAADDHHLCRPETCEHVAEQAVAS